MNVRVVVFPPEPARFFLDLEPIGAETQALRVQPGRHELLVVPRSLRWGSRTVRFTVTHEDTLRIVVRLRAVLHARAIFRAALAFAYGAITAALLTLLPFPAWSRGDSDLRGGASLLAVFGGIPLALLFIVPIWLLAVRLRGLLFVDVPLRGVLARGLLAFACGTALLSFYDTYLSAIVVRPGFAFAVWALANSALLSVLLFLVPWEREGYRER